MKSFHCSSMEETEGCKPKMVGNRVAGTQLTSEEYSVRVQHVLLVCLSPKSQFQKASSHTIHSDSPKGSMPWSPVRMGIKMQNKCW